MTECDNLERLDLSRNSFENFIPSELGKLKHLKFVQLNENKFTGTIPKELFNAVKVKALMLQSNSLSGTIPAEIGNLKDAVNISLAYNGLQETIPTELSALSSLERLQLHQNRLIGVAPDLSFEQRKHENYITDCGAPFFSLSAKLECETCTICCNSLNQCLRKDQLYLSLNGYKILFICLAVPIAWLLFFSLVFHSFRETYFKILRKTRSSLSVFNKDSVYCLIHSDSLIAWIIYGFTALMQFLLFLIFMVGSKFDPNDSNWIFPIFCPANDLTCVDEKEVSLGGWFVFFLITMIFLGQDFIDGILQLQQSVIMKKKRFAISGIVLITLAMWALITSVRFNQGLAEKNTDLITNTVILLFINDIDEQLLKVLESAIPSWVSARFEEIEENFTRSDVPPKKRRFTVARLFDSIGSVTRSQTSSKAHEMASAANEIKKEFEGEHEDDYDDAERESDSDSSHISTFSAQERKDLEQRKQLGLKMLGLEVL